MVTSLIIGDRINCAFGYLQREYVHNEVDDTDFYLMWNLHRECRSCTKIISNAITFIYIMSTLIWSRLQKRSMNVTGETSWEVCFHLRTPIECVLSFHNGHRILIHTGVLDLQAKYGGFRARRSGNMFYLLQLRFF